MKTPASTVWFPATVFMYSVAAMPATIPIYPKKVVIVTLSAMISHKIDIGLAPNALRIPNSRVRSFTVISMILLTPTMPLSKVNMPITQMAIVRMRIPFSCCRNWVKRFHIQIAPLSSAVNRWCTPIALRYSFSKISFFSSVSSPCVINIKLFSLSPLLYMSCKVVNGMKALGWKLPLSVKRPTT